jgi:predicted transcriptional regulator
LPSESRDIKKLLRKLYLLRVILYLSFIIAIGTTTILVAPALFQSATSGTAVPAAQTQTFAASATTALYTNTLSSQGGYGLISAPLTPTPITSFGLTALLSWAVFGAALIWRGRVRSVWGQSRFSYDTFRLVVKMRGAQTRLNLMHSLNSPKNKLQLATALGIDWKAVDRHVQVLEKNGLIHATSTTGTTTFYEVTEKGKDLIQVLEQLNAESSP